jgi:glutamyl-tRNA synthetase
MKISHVIRGEEWLPSLPLHVLLYRAFDWYSPKFAHLPLILKPIGKGKLSKRDGDKMGFPVFPLAYTNEETGDVSRGYKEDGYFADAFINMLSLLGWNPGTEKEIFSLEELVFAFDISRVNKSGAKFDLDKTNWFNQQYLQKKSNLELVSLFMPILKHKKIDVTEIYVEKVVTLIKERAVFITDFWELSNYFFTEPLCYEEKAVKKQWKPETGKLMTELINVISEIKDFSSLTIEKVVKEWIGEKEIGFGKVMQPLRLAIVGEMKGPNIFEIIQLIGEKETTNRIEKIIKQLS